MFPPTIFEPLRSRRSAVELAALARPLLRRAALGAVLGAILAGAAGFVAPPRFESRARVVVMRQHEPALVTEALGNVLEHDEVLWTEVALATARTTLEAALDRVAVRPAPSALERALASLGLVEPPGPRERALAELRRGLEVVPMLPSDLLELRVRADDPAEARARLAAVTEAYLERRRALYADDVLAFLRARRERLAAEVRALERAVAREADWPRRIALEIEGRALRARYLDVQADLDGARMEAEAPAHLGNVRLVDAPSLPAEPVRSRLDVAGLGALAGALLGAAAGGLVLRRPVVRGPEDLAAGGARVLGSVRRAGRGAAA